MFSIEKTREQLCAGAYSRVLADLYATTSESTKVYSDRFCGALDKFTEIFGDSSTVALFSAPGRTEIGGNHTDHQHGHVLAASVNLDVIAVASPNASGIIRIKSEGYNMDTIDLSDLSVKKEEYNRAGALIRGIAAKLTEMGYTLGGFDAYTTSNVLSGSGLSSSAAFEVLVGNIMNAFYCSSEVSPVEIAKIGQYAENVYFGKPCGLMDQTASSVGGIITIDFKSTVHPVVEKVEYDFTKSGYALCILDSGADHSDLTDEYASIPQEMKLVASFFGKDFLEEVDEADFYAKLPALRTAVCDRAVLRAIHFFADDKRVVKQVACIRENRFDDFLSLVNESGRSSFMYLQNIFVPRLAEKEQAMSVTLALCEHLLEGQGAFRVHGGGFAGTVQAFVPLTKLEAFRTGAEAVLGKGNCHVLSIRALGGCVLKTNENY